MDNITSLEVKRAFILANAGKNVFLNGASSNSTESRIRELVLKNQEIGESDADDIIGKEHELRVIRYNALSWYTGEVDFTNMGCFHGMCGLDFNLTKGSVLETAKEFERFPDELKRKIESIVRFYNLVSKNFLPILVPGGLERQFWYNEHWKGKVGHFHRIYEHDIDDGNSRCVAFAYMGLQSIKSYYGRYQGNLRDLHRQEVEVHP